MKVFLDASVLFSAARPGSLLAQFIDRLARHASLCSNAYALDEAQRNLERKEAACLAHLEKLRLNLVIVYGVAPLPHVSIRDKDRPILEAAVAARCSYLLTSDRRDFGPFFGQTIEGTKVVSPELMAEEIGLEPRKGQR